MPISSYNVNLVKFSFQKLITWIFKHYVYVWFSLILDYVKGMTKNFVVFLNCIIIVTLCVIFIHFYDQINNIIIWFWKYTLNHLKTHKLTCFFPLMCLSVVSNPLRIFPNSTRKLITIIIAISTMANKIPEESTQ